MVLIVNVLELTTHFSDDMIVLEKWVPKKPLSVVYFDGKKEKYFAKRFLVENENREEMFISENKGSFLELVSTVLIPQEHLVQDKQDALAMCALQIASSRKQDSLDEDNLIENLENKISSLIGFLEKNN